MEKKEIKIEIKNKITGKVMFEYSKIDNTVKETVIEAVKNGAYLRGADLGGADLGGAYLSDAYLRGADLGGADLGGANLRGAYLRGADLSDADLSDADLRCADLCGAYLYGADLGGADLRGAYLRGADLRGADLRGADLRGADLSCAYLSDANLRCADLGGADLRGAYLRCAYLRGADLRGADLRGAKNISFIPFACPSDGSFVGWKKISDYSENYSGKYLVKLRIPDDARRCSANTTKCRCDKAEVLEITNIETNEKVDVITNTNEVRCVYKVGEMVYPDSFDEVRWNECSHGIHFFINKQEAIDY